MTTLASDSLDILHVSKHYAQRGAALAVLDDVSLHVRAGEFVTIVGSSGCGKSTLLRLIAGLDTDYAGEIRAGAERVHDTSLQRGIVFQDHRLFPWLTVAQNIEAALRNAPLDAAAKRRAVADHIALVGLNGFEHAYPNQLSGGMAQRVAIARGLVNRPRVLLLDEPFGALDAQTRARMQTHLLDIWRNIDVTILFITHDLDEAIFLADRILVLKANPGAVQELIEVPVPRPRDYSQVNTPEFVATKARLEALIHPKEAVAIDDGVRPHMIRMTDVSDNVE